MTYFILLALWAAFLTGWLNVLYLHSCGIRSVKPDYSLILKSLVAGVASLLLGTFCNALVQSMLHSYVKLGH